MAACFISSDGRRAPFRKPTREPAAVPLASVPGRVDLAACRDQQHYIEPLGASQGVDCLARALRDGACNIEGGIDRYLDADAAAERFQVCVGEGIVRFAHDLDSPGAVGV